MARIVLIALSPVMLIAAVVGLLAYAVTVVTRPQSAWRIAVGFDQLVNVSFRGDEDETVSSRAAKGARQGVWGWCLLCRILDRIDAGHCEQNVEPDEGSAP